MCLCQKFLRFKQTQTKSFQSQLIVQCATFNPNSTIQRKKTHCPLLSNLNIKYLFVCLTLHTLYQTNFSSTMNCRCLFYWYILFPTHIYEGPPKTSKHTLTNVVVQCIELMIQNGNTGITYTQIRNNTPKNILPLFVHWNSDVKQKAKAHII